MPNTPVLRVTSKSPTPALLERRRPMGAVADTEAVMCQAIDWLTPKS
jgi:hypothetical protein